MDLGEFRSLQIKQKIGIDDAKFHKILVFIDFSNVNKWFAEDIRDWNNNILDKGAKLSIDLEKLYSFVKCFSDHVRFYYGHDPQNINSLKFLGKTKYVFGENMVFSKPIQQIKHYLNETERNINTRQIYHGNEGDFIYLPKCNFV